MKKPNGNSKAYQMTWIATTQMNSFRHFRSDTLQNSAKYHLESATLLKIRKRVAPEIFAKYAGTRA